MREHCPQTPGITVRDSVTQDLEEHTRQLQDWHQRYDQLDHGTFEGRFTDIRCLDLQIFVEGTSRAIRQVGRLADASVGFCVPLTRGALYFDGARAGPGALLMAATDTELDLCTPSDCTLVGMVLQSREFDRALEVWTDAPDWLRAVRGLEVFTPTPAALHTWLGHFRRAVGAITQQPYLLQFAQTRQQLRDELLVRQLQLLASAVPANPLGKIDAAKRLVDRACEAMLSHTDQPISLIEICRLVGASPRKLGYCFQNTLGMSPGKFIKTTRLNAVRRELSRADPGGNVYDTAARWGFWHFGHFSTDYKKLFGESPSDTLRRGRRPRQACAATGFRPLDVQAHHAAAA